MAAAPFRTQTLDSSGVGDATADALIDSIIVRLERAKAAHAAGDLVSASREFDPRYKVVTPGTKLEANEAFALAHGREPVECAECGHLHWWGSKYGYGPCPLRHEGCDCKGQPE